MPVKAAHQIKLILMPEKVINLMDLEFKKPIFENQQLTKLEVLPSRLQFWQ